MDEFLSITVPIQNVQTETATESPARSPTTPVQGPASHRKPINDLEHARQLMTINIFPRSQEGEPWSSVLFGMVNSLKPVKQQQQQQQPPHLASVDHQHPTFASVSTHHEGIYKQNKTDDISPRPVKKQKLSQTRIPSSWTRSTANTEPSDPTPRPPSKLTRTAPDSELLQTTNGVSTRIDAGDEDIQLDPAQAVQAKHTTDAKGKSQKEESRKTQDRRSLRSHDEGSRLKSDLAIYFPNYEDIINDVPQEKGTTIRLATAQGF